MFWCERTNTRNHVCEHSWLSGWVILSILAHLAHLAQFYFSLIFSAINTYNCFWFDLTNKKNQWLKTKAWWKIINAYDFFPHGGSRHYWYRCARRYIRRRRASELDWRIVIATTGSRRCLMSFFFSRVHATLQPALSVGWSVGRLVGHTLLFLWFYFFDLAAPA